MFPICEKPLKLTRCMADCHMLDSIHYCYMHKLNVSRTVSERKNYIKNNVLNIQRSKSNPI